MATWPAGLPQRPLLQGASEQGQGTVVRTDMDVGPAKLRRRYTAEITRFDIALILTTAQVATLETFYDSTVNGGVDPFDWSHPRTLAAAEFRFVSRPAYQPLGADYWRTAFVLEVLP